jgi:hypothetical protein
LSKLKIINLHLLYCSSRPSSPRRHDGVQFGVTRIAELVVPAENVLVPRFAVVARHHLLLTAYRVALDWLAHADDLARECQGVIVRGSRVTGVQNRIEPQKSVSGTSVDYTEAGNGHARRGPWEGQS